jgi:signal transduction histidine kinase
VSRNGTITASRTPPAYFVRDNGVGFDPAYKDKLFKPFQRLHDERSYAGTGLGLTTVQRVVRLHGGRVWADATPDAGAVFSFTLAPEPETATHDADALTEVDATPIDA